MNSEIFTVGETWRSILISLDKIKVSWLKFSMGLTNRRPSKNMLFLFLLLLFFFILFYFFYLFFLTLTVQKFQGISNLTISADLHGILAPKLRFSKLEKKIPMFFKNSLLEIILRPYNLPFSEKAERTSKTQRLILIYKGE